jgi:hypothetical protein
MKWAIKEVAVSKGNDIMRILLMVAAFSMLVSPSLSSAGPKENVAAVMQTWIDGMNKHNMDEVAALYDSEAVFLGYEVCLASRHPSCCSGLLQASPDRPTVV